MIISGRYGNNGRLDESVGIRKFHKGSIGVSIMDESSEQQDYEEEKRERRRLRGRQRTLVTSYVKAVQAKDFSYIERLKDNFLEALEIEKRVDAYIGVESSRYPIFFDNIFSALGFRIYRGTIPTISGIQPDQPFHAAFDTSRTILIRSFPSTLFAEIADIQPIASKPILGVSHTTWVKGKADVDKWERKYTQISTALGIGRLQISTSEILKRGIELDPKQDQEKLRQIAKQIGLIDFLSLPVDNFPLYGSFRLSERHKNFDEKNLKKMFFSSVERGHQLAPGTLTSINPVEALENPKVLIKQLDKSDLIEGLDKIRVTPSGKKYIGEKLIGTAQEAVLLKTTDLSILEDLKSEFRSLERNISTSISSSKQDILTAINEVKLQISETTKKGNILAKYIIELPPSSPIKLRIEIPIGEISEEDIFLKMAEIKTKIQSLPRYLIAELRNSIENLPKIPQHIKGLLLRAFNKEGDNFGEPSGI